MKQLLRVAVVIGFAALLAACASTTKTTTVSSSGQKYSEDLTALRPKPAAAATENKAGGTSTPTTEGRKQTPNVEPKYAVNKKLDSVLDSIDHINVQRTYIDGFTIQVYSGARKEDAMKAKQELTSSLPDLHSEVLYSQPNFRVKVGKYYSRVEAQKDYLDVKRLFPTAIVIPDKVAIN
jgi:outer membrane murein-binding lipoprotein Lpp